MSNNVYFKVHHPLMSIWPVCWNQTDQGSWKTSQYSNCACSFRYVMWMWRKYVKNTPMFLGGDKSVCTDIAEVTSLVSSVVIESDNNIVLDFSTNIEDGELGSENNEEDSSSISATARSGASSTSLLSKVIKVCSVFLTNYF